MSGKFEDLYILLQLREYKEAYKKFRRVDDGKTTNYPFYVVEDHRLMAHAPPPN